MKMTRRLFLGSAGAFVVLRARAAERPLWTAGIVTDTHVRRTRKSCQFVEKACRLFAARKVDLFVNCGDIADHYFPEAYPILKEMTDAVFTDKPTRKLWVYANHDRIDREREPWESVMKDVKRLLGATNDIYDTFDMNGWPFVVFPQWVDYAKAESMLAETAAKYPGKPIFVVDHIPASVPKFEGRLGGDPKRNAVYEKFPQVIQICGHKHGSLRAEFNIWQGAFTSVNMGCLFNWQGSAVGNSPPSKHNYGAVVMEVFADRVVFRRFDVRTGKEYGADDPWTIPLPFDPATAPYRRERASAREPVPQFPKGAKLTLSADKPFSTLSMTFPCAASAHGTYLYKVQVLSKDGEPLTRCDLFGQFYLPEAERTATLERKLSAGYFDAGRAYRVRITPCNCFGGAGKPLEATFVAPKDFGRMELRFESADPMSECPFRQAFRKGLLLVPKKEALVAKSGWYEIADGNYVLEFPAKAWDGPKGARFRFTVDLETDQPGAKTWTLVLRHTDKIENANNRIQTPHGRSGKMRYVMEIKKKADDFPCCLLVREGSKGRIRFNRVKLEKLA